MVSTCMGVSAYWRPSDLQSTKPYSSVNGLDFFENLNEFNYLRRKVFQKVLERSRVSFSGIQSLEFHEEESSSLNTLIILRKLSPFLTKSITN